MAIGGVNQNNPVPQQQVDSTRTAGGTTATGAGTAAGAAKAPDVVVVAVVLPAYAPLLESIQGMIPKMSGDAVSVALLQVTVAMKELEEKSQKTKVEVDQEKQRTALAAKLDQLNESTKKIKEAIEKEKNMSFWDKLKAFFSFL